MATERSPLRRVNTLSRQRMGSTGRAQRVEETRSYRPRAIVDAMEADKEPPVSRVGAGVDPVTGQMAPTEEGPTAADMGYGPSTATAQGASTPAMAAAMDVQGRAATDIGQDIAGAAARTAGAAYNAGVTDPSTIAGAAVRSAVAPMSVLSTANKAIGVGMGTSKLASQLEDPMFSEDDLARSVQTAKTTTPEQRGQLEMSPEVRAAVEAIDEANYGSLTDQILGSIKSGIAGLFGYTPEETQSTARGKSLGQRAADALDPTMADKEAVDAAVAEAANNPNPSSFGNPMGLGTNPRARINTIENRRRLALGLPALPTTRAEATEAEPTGPSGLERGDIDPNSFEAKQNIDEALDIVARHGYHQDPITGEMTPNRAGNVGASEGTARGDYGAGYDSIGYGDMGTDEGNTGSQTGGGTVGGNPDVDAAENDAMGGPGNNDGDRVICSHLVAVGISNRTFLAADNLFARIYCNREIVAGYHFWAKPLVKFLERAPRWVTHLCVKPWGMAYSFHCQYRLGLRDKDSTGGRLFAKIVMPACEIIGKVLKTIKK